VTRHRRLPSPLELAESAPLSELFGSVRSAFLVVRRVTGAENWGDVEVGDCARGVRSRRFIDHQEMLQPLMNFLEERGRLPHPGELPKEVDNYAALGGVRRAFSLVGRATGSSRWNEFATRRREDFLLYVALSAFGRRPRFSDLPADLQHDARDFFGSYRAARDQATCSWSLLAILKPAMRRSRNVRSASSHLRRSICTLARLGAFRL